MDEVVARRARAAGFSTPDEFVSDSMERILAEDAQHEVAVLEGLRSEISPLTREDLDSIRSIARQARERSSAQLAEVLSGFTRSNTRRLSH